MRIEDVFASRGRVRILRILAEIGELNISALARRAGLNYSTAREHLRVLEAAGLVRHKSFGRIRIFRFNDEDARARMIRQLVELWERTTQS
ncbi:MAG: winged helix-turn-helix domain-containing protein [Candidatus Bathyarchaeota archaeon]|nr:winged helix-turn-helix domain-containing protein [Candidatus Bathyarchaeota archaeon]MDH5779886.1 winged helix-turn-helix domain-containing protein [Candidatus Bathyarchaeota archaeon]